jgi:hypothetical protein
VRIPAQWKSVRGLEIPGPFRKQRVTAMAAQTLLSSNPVIFQRDFITMGGIAHQLNQCGAHGPRVAVLADESKTLVGMR